MKRIILVFCLVFSCLFTFTGCGNLERERNLYVDNSDVALLSIFADDGKSESRFLFRNHGHSFLSVENISNSSFMVGDRQVKPNETITIGLWSIQEHFGVWFNLESNYILETQKYENRVSLTIGIDAEDIANISKIIDENNEWTPIYNCAKFASEVWNSVADDEEKIETTFFVSPASNSCKVSPQQ